MSKKKLSLKNIAISEGYENLNIASLLTFKSEPAKGIKFTIKDGKKGGYFFYNDRRYQGKKLENLTFNELLEVEYIPSSPESNSVSLSAEEKSLAKFLKNPTNYSSTKGINKGIVDTIRVVGKDKRSRVKFKAIGKIRNRLNWAPEINAKDQSFSANQKPTNLLDIVSATDLDGDSTLKYRITDLDTSNESGFFKQDGEPISQGSFETSDLSTIQYIPGASGNKNSVRIEAIDNKGAIAAKEIVLSTNKSLPPTLSISDKTFSKTQLTSPIPLNDLIGVEDPDGDSLQVTVTDTRNSDISGYFIFEDPNTGEDLKRQKEPYETIEFPLDSLDQVYFVPGLPNLKRKESTLEIYNPLKIRPFLSQPPEKKELNNDTSIEQLFVDNSNSIQFKATDGTFTVSKRVQWNTEENQRPSISVKDRIWSPVVSVRDPFPINDLISFADPNGDSIQSITIEIDEDSDGSFILNQQETKRIVVAADELKNILYKPSAPNTQAKISAIVNDGFVDSKIYSASWEVYPIKSPKDAEKDGIILDPNPPIRLGEMGDDGKATIEIPVKANFSKNLGDLLGIDNEASISEFIGIDVASTNKVYKNNIINFLGNRVGYEFNTGNNKFKTGLFADAGYGLGGINASGGMNVSLSYESATKEISFNSEATDDLNIDIAMPYAYLKAGALADITFKPSLKGTGRLAPIKVFGATLVDEKKGSTGNLLAPFNFSYKKSLNWIDLDTRNLTGDSFSKQFKLGPLSAKAKLPAFGSDKALAQVPQAIQNHPDWIPSDSTYAWGLSGNTELFDIDLSLGELIKSITGLPLKFSTGKIGINGIGNVSANATLLDATVGAGADFIHEISLAMAPNLNVKIEGISGNQGSNFTLAENNFSSLDEDSNGIIDIEVSFDPLIGAHVLGKLDTQFSGSISALSASASFNILGKSGSAKFGPLFDTSFPISSKSIDLVKVTDVWKLSDLGISLPSETISLPINILETTTSDSEGPSLGLNGPNPSSTEIRSTVSPREAKQLLELLG